jgi:hypothetical protein
VPLDRLRNATRVRRRNLGQPDPTVEATGLDPIAQILEQHYERTRPSTPHPTPNPKTKKED